MVGVIFGWLLIGFGVFIFVVMPIWHKFSCGPNSQDVKIMKPQVKAIVNYVTKNGIPKSLKDIPGLPYALLGCESNGIRAEKCYFYIDSNKYDVKMHYRTYDYNLRIFTWKSETGVSIYLENNENKWIMKNEIKSYSSKSSGICKPFGRQ